MATKRREWVVATAVAVGLLTACEQQHPTKPTALAESGRPGVASEQRSQERPFTGTVKGNANFILSNPRRCPAGYTTVTDARGTSSHLGLTSVHWEHCVSPTGMAGDVVIAGANGDEIHGTFAGARVPPGPMPPVGEFLELVGTMSFTGGTGRVANATGTARYTGRLLWEGYQDPSSPGEWAWEGVIRY